MICPKCGEEMEQQDLCPHCGAALTGEPVEETAEEIAEEAAEETTEVSAEEIPEDAEEAEEETAAEATEDPAEEPEAPVEETQEAPKKKKSLGAIIAGVVIAFLVVAVVCLGVCLKVVLGGGSLPDISAKIEAWKQERQENKFDPAAPGITVTDESGAVVSELNNEQLAYYYWGEYYYFVNTYGFQFDSAMRLDEQVYESLTDSATGETTVTTWHQYFLESACYSINQMESLKADGNAADFTMPEDFQAEYEAILDSMATNAATAGFVDESGNGDALAYIQDSYGPNATMEGFSAYLFDSYYASAYSDHIYESFTYSEEDIVAYYDENAESFASYGIEKTEYPNVNVRHILIEPEADEEGNISDEAKAEAKEAAEALYQQWQDGDATEETFAELANENSTDPGSNTVGGLYEDVYPGQMVTAFNDWCFDEEREVGDTGIVETDYGYHIMYFVSQTDSFYWKDAAESDLRYYAGAEYLENLAAGYTSSVTETAEVRYPDAVKSIMNSVG